MKNLNKKIGAIVLSGIVVSGGVFVSGGSAHANSLKSDDVIDMMSDEMIFLHYLHRSEQEYGFKVIEYNINGDNYHNYPDKKRHISGSYGFEQPYEFLNYIKRYKRGLRPGLYSSKIGKLSFLFKLD